MNKRPVFLLVGSLLLLAVTACAAEGPEASGPLKFSDFYRRVLAYYPKLKQQEADVNLAIARKLQAVSGFLPRVQSQASVSRGDEPVFVVGSVLREKDFTAQDLALSRLNTPRPHTTYNVTLTGQMPIFDAFQTISRVRAARLQLESAREEEKFTRMEAFLVATEAYLRAAAVENLLEIVNTIGQASTQDISQAEELKGKGLILGADFYSAKVTSGGITRIQNELAQEKQAAHILLNILMGEDPLKPVEIEKSLAVVIQDDIALQGWFDAAYKSRPDLAALDGSIRAQDIEVFRERSTMLPRLDAFGEARDDTGSFHSDGGQNYVFGVKLQMDLFDPSYSARVRASRETLRKMELEKSILRDNIAKDITNEFAHYKGVKDNLPVVKSMMDDAGQAVELMAPLYREGRKSIADLLNIRYSYLEAARSYYVMIVDNKASWTRLLFLSGQLDEAHINEAARRLSE